MSTEKNARANGTKTVKHDKRTDLRRWRMLDDDGRQTWHYLEDDKEAEAWPQSFADRYFLSLPTVSVPPPAKMPSQLLTAIIRMLPSYRNPKPLLMRLRMDSNSSNTCSSLQETGLRNMADPYFS
jgi:hypothetical protein